MLDGRDAAFGLYERSRGGVEDGSSFRRMGGTFEMVPERKEFQVSGTLSCFSRETVLKGVFLPFG